MGETYGRSIVYLVHSAICCAIMFNLCSITGYGLCRVSRKMDMFVLEIDRWGKEDEKKRKRRLK